LKKKKGVPTRKRPASPENQRANISTVLRQREKRVKPVHVLKRREKS